MAGEPGGGGGVEEEGREKKREKKEEEKKVRVRRSVPLLRLYQREGAAAPTFVE